MTIEGLDISHWQSTINWQKMKAAGVKFIYLKCSEGTYYQDDTFANNYANAKANGIKVGAYHFLTSEPATAQFNWFKRHGWAGVRPRSCYGHGDTRYQPGVSRQHGYEAGSTHAC